MSAAATAGLSKRPFIITGADGQELAIEAGEYYFNTKARARFMMINKRLSTYAWRVYSSCEMGTMGFQQELAVTMENGKVRPLTPSDIAKQTGLSDQHVRSALVELEEAGVVLRKADDGKGLRKGHVLIYSWATPRVSSKTQNTSGAQPELIPEWFPESWEPLAPYIRRFRLRFAVDEETARSYFAEGEALARNYEKTQELVEQFFDRLCARPVKSGAYKEERTERKIEEKEPSSSALFVVSKPEPETPTPTPISIDLKNPEPEPAPKEPEPEPTPEPDDRAIVAEGCRAIGAELDPAALTQLLTECRKAAPTVTAHEIVAAAIEKAPKARAHESLVGFILHSVPPLFAEGGLERRRAGLKPRTFAAPRSHPADEHFREVLDDPEAPESEKKIARQVLGIADDGPQ